MAISTLKPAHGGLRDDDGYDGGEIVYVILTRGFARRRRKVGFEKALSIGQSPPPPQQPNNPLTDGTPTCTSLLKILSPKSRPTSPSNPSTTCAPLKSDLLISAHVKLAISSASVSLH
ncbi:hypothetical protein EV2_006410 [Malus domestica]